MIAFLKGELAAVTTTSVYIDVSGVGFEVALSQRSLQQLPALGSSVMLYTYLQVRDDGMNLFGFLTTEEKALFEELISVSGVGPKVALAALSFYAPAELAQAISTQDVTRIAKIPGIGKKTAQRIILELKGVLDEDLGGLFGQNEAALARDAGSASGQQDVLKGIAEALLSMGFSSAETDLALAGAPTDASESAILQYALKRLGSVG